MAHKKRIFNANRNSARKLSTIESLADLSPKNEVFKEVLNGAQLENKDDDSDKKFSDCKTINKLTFDSLNHIEKKLNFDKKSDQVVVQSSSSNKNIDQLSKSSSSLNFISNAKSVIDKLKNMQIHPSVHIYSITPEGKGISAVDVCSNLSHLAYSFSHSGEIRLFARKSLSDSIARNDLNTTWLNYVSAKNQLIKLEKSEKEIAESLSSPQEYIIRHNNDVSGLCFSSDDRILLSCSLDGSAKVISTTTYGVLENYDGYGIFTDINVNFSTTQFATTNVLSWKPFHVVYLYNFERKSPVQCFSGHKSTLKCVHFHPNGLYVATASSDRSIKLWSVQQSKEVRCFQDEGIDHPEKITFSPDGKCIASTHRGGCVKIWDIASGRKLKCLEVSNSCPCILNICYNSTGSMLAAGGSDKQIHFWNINSDRSSEMTPDYNLLKSECLNKRIFSIKYVKNFFSCVTG